MKRKFYIFTLLITSYFFNSGFLFKPEIKALICAENYSELEKDLGNILWHDASQIFIKEQIVIPGAFDYKLKHIACALLKHKKIKCKWDDDVQN